MPALFGERTEPPLRELAEEQTQSLRTLWVRREQLLEMLVIRRTGSSMRRPSPRRSGAAGHSFRSHCCFSTSTSASPPLGKSSSLQASWEMSIIIFRCLPPAIWSFTVSTTDLPFATLVTFT